MQSIKGKHFKDETVRLDGKSFEDCTFTNCVLEISGAEMFAMPNSVELTACRWVLTDAADRTIQILTGLYHSGPSGRELIEATLANIRRGKYVKASAQKEQAGWTIILGATVVSNCDAALIVNDVEVFRVREQAGDQRIVADFEVRNTENVLQAKVSRNNVVFASPGLTVTHGPRFSEVRHAETGELLARAEEVAPRTIRITGTFTVDGYTVTMTESKLTAGVMTMEGGHISGYGKAIVLRRGATMIGVR